VAASTPALNAEATLVLLAALIAVALRLLGLQVLLPRRRKRRVSSLTREM